MSEELLRIADGRNPKDAILTSHGKLFWVTDPRPGDVHLNDIARSLGAINRFIGHGRWNISVATHSSLLFRLIPDHLKEQGLFHDATEAYMTDIPKPLKERVGLFEGFSEAEDRLFEVICESLRLPFRKLSEEFTDYDRRMGRAELLVLFPHGEDYLNLLGVPSKKIEEAKKWMEYIVPESTYGSGSKWKYQAGSVIKKYENSTN